MTGWRVWSLHADRVLGHVRDGHFALHGLQPDGEEPVYFLEPSRKLGAAARLSGRAEANLPVTVRLEPCGTALARLITPDSKPLPHYPASRLLSMIITPGPPSRPPTRANEPKDKSLFANESAVAAVDPVNYASDFQSDAEGLLVFPALIPGAPYRIVDRTAAVGGGEPELRKEFTVRSGQALHLGDILIARPRRRN